VGAVRFISEEYRSWATHTADTKVVMTFEQFGRYRATLRDQPQAKGGLCEAL
jgi:hypothetical protein